MRSTFVLSILAVAVPAFGAPTLIPITKRAGPVKPDSYLITFKDKASGDSALQTLTSKFAASGSRSSVIYDYRRLFNGAAVRVVGRDMLSSIQSMSGIESIEPDMIVSINYEQGLDGFPVTEPPETKEALPLVERTGTTGGGQGVTVYGIDTGIYIEHNCFGGRASWGAVFGEGNQQEDGNGHGTHTAATAVGDKYGIATDGKVVAVKVLSDAGSGAVSDVIAGVQWAYKAFKNGGGPGVATMSLGGPTTGTALNMAVQEAIRGGLHFTIAAGNSNIPADGTSPANVEEANTIGAVDSSKNNRKASFSNYGTLIDVWAPGVNIESAWIGNPDAKNTISGTSMATPYVAGIIAGCLSKDPNTTPPQMSELLKKNAKEVVTFAPADMVAKFTSNKLLAQLCK